MEAGRKRPAVRCSRRRGEVRWISEMSWWCPGCQRYIGASDTVSVPARGADAVRGAGR